MMRDHIAEVGNMISAFTRRRNVFVFGAFLTMTACATPEPRVITRDVEIPVAVRCAPDIGPEPQYPDTPEAIAAAPDIFALAKLYVAGRLMRMARDEVKSAALRGCAG